MTPPLPVILLFGPTAVGKTDLLVRTLSGRAEVINADSMQVYRYMDIGTAKPDTGVLDALPHHLIDIKNPNEQYNAGEFVHAADGLVLDIASRGKIPVVSGGTAFYLRNFIYGLPESPPGDPEIRGRLKDELEVRGLEPLFRELKAVDPAAADRISPADTYRILRGIEVYRLTGRPVSSFTVRERPRGRHRFLVIGLERPRRELYARINRRVDGMFQAGLSAEVKHLVRMGYRKEDPGLRAIGYREFFQMMEEGCTSFSAVRERIQRNTRRFAKRQITFFKRLPDVRWYTPEEPAAVYRAAEAFLANG